MKTILTFSLVILVTAYTCKDDNKIIDDDFLQDLSSEDNRIWGEFYLDIFNGDLSKLTYDYYIGYLDSTQSPGAEGIVEKIKIADSKLLKPVDETFWLLLYYNKDNLIIADDASTDIGTVDTVFIYSNDSSKPDLNSYMVKILNK